MYDDPANKQTIQNSPWFEPTMINVWINTGNNLYTGRMESQGFIIY